MSPELQIEGSVLPSLYGIVLNLTFFSSVSENVKMPLHT